MLTIQRSNISGNQKKIKTNTSTYENFSYFLGGIDVTHQNLDKITPYIQGVSRIFVHKTPYFMDQLDDETMSKRFKTYVETGYKEIGGIQNLSVNFTTFEGGFNNQNFQNVANSSDESNSLSITVYELTGSPIREYLDTWVTGVRDPRSGIAHYHGLIQKYYNGTTGGVPYAEKNHTAEFIYTTYDPTGLYLEYACMFAHCFPQSVPKDHLNYQSGNREGVTMQLEFAAEHYESPAINDIGIWYTENSKVNWNYLDFSPEAGNGIMRTQSAYTYDYGVYQNNTEHKYAGKNPAINDLVPKART